VCNKVSVQCSVFSVQNKNKIKNISQMHFGNIF